MAYEMIVGLEVINDEVYTEYRNAMAPYLKEAEGGFRYDFKVAETLKDEGQQVINRVFAIYFGDEKKMNHFFSREEYLAVKAKYFEKSVAHTSIISQYERE